jgi:hypothetical protein
MMSKIKSRSGINPSLHQNFLDVSIILTGLNPMEANKPLGGAVVPLKKGGAVEAVKKRWRQIFFIVISPSYMAPNLQRQTLHFPS